MPKKLNKKKSSVDVWLERETSHKRKALENASLHFDRKDALTVNTLEAIYKESPTRIYRLWLYPIDEMTFQLREIGTIIPTAKIRKIMATLSEKKYSKYWITSVK